VLLDAKADLLVYGKRRAQICDSAHRLAGGESIGDITDLRGTVFARRATPGTGSRSIPHLDAPGPLNTPVDRMRWRPQELRAGSRPTRGARVRQPRRAARKSCASCAA